LRNGALMAMVVITGGQDLPGDGHLRLPADG
jgi:hypothetical protein